MARKFALASTQYLLRSGASPIDSIPLSMACWFNVSDEATSQCLLGLFDASANANRNMLFIGGAGNYLVYQYVDSTDTGSNPTTNPVTISFGAWQHGCGIVAATNDQRVILNGNVKGTTSAERAGITWSLVDSTVVGARVYNSTVDLYTNGSVAAAGLWRGILEDNDAMLLAKKHLCPLLVKPRHLVAYWDLRHGDNADWLGRYGIVPVNAPTDLAPPPIVYPERDDPVWGLVLPRYRPRRYWVLGKAYVRGTTTWGHDTEVAETNIRDFSGNWTGTGTVDGSGDNERIELSAGEYMESEVVNTGSYLIELDQNYYSSGDDVTMKYRHGISEAACLAAAFGAYTVPFDSLGYVQIRLESTL